MSTPNLFVLTVGVCMAGGLLHMLGASLLFLIVFSTAPLWWPEIFGYHAPVLAYASSLAIATVTLMLGGVPAALLERLTRAQGPSTASMATWLAACSLLTLAGLAIGFG